MGEKTTVFLIDLFYLGGVLDQKKFLIRSIAIGVLGGFLVFYAKQAGITPIIKALETVTEKQTYPGETFLYIFSFIMHPVIGAVSVFISGFAVISPLNIVGAIRLVFLSKEVSGTVDPQPLFLIIPLFLILAYLAYACILKRLRYLKGKMKNTYVYSLFALLISFIPLIGAVPFYYLLLVKADSRNKHLTTSSS